MWVSPKFFLFPGIFPLKIEKSVPAAKKLHKKFYWVRSQFVIATVAGPVSAFFGHKRTFPNVRRDVRFTPKSGH
jgi:hypothetical protein